jgi:hypothetical protein
MIVSLSEVKAIVFECASCKSRTAIVPEKLDGVPEHCPNGHLWQSNIGLDHSGYIFGAFITSIKALRITKEKENGFKILLEFEEPRP